METVARIMLLVGIVGLVVWQGLKKIPANPPQKGVVTFLGERTGIVFDEGWVILPLYPFLFGVILVDMTAKNQDFNPDEVRTAGDMAEIEVKASLTFKPDPKNLINYLDSGGEKGVREILDDVIPEAIRELAANPIKPPMTWEDAVKMKPIFLAEIVATVIGKDPATIPADDLKKSAAELRRGNGDIKIEALGVVISRLNVVDVNPKGELAKAAENLAKEKRDKLAEKEELDGVIARIKELMAPPIGYSKEQALEIVQTERKKVVKEIKEHKISLSSDTAGALTGLFADIFKK